MIRRMILSAIFCLYTAYGTSYALKFIAYGDSRDNLPVNQTQAALWETENPGCIVNVGDVWGDTPQNSWKTTFTGKPNLSALLTANKVCVALGNHETWDELSAFTPSLVKGSSTQYYSFTEGNCFFVCMGYDPAQNYTWLRQQLSSAASTAATWRFVFMHKPIYSSYDGHGADGVTSEGSEITLFRNYCDTFKVTMAFYGHDHGYERTKLIYNGRAVAAGTTFDLSQTPGTVYVLTGGGGAPLYTPSSQWWVGYQQATYCFQVVDARNDTCPVSTKNDSGRVVDQWKFIRAPVTRTITQGAICAVGKCAFVRSCGNSMAEIAGPAGSAYSVIGLSGKDALRGRLSRVTERLDLSGVRKGVYIVKINGLVRKVFLK